MSSRHTIFAVCIAALPIYLSVQSCTISSKVITSTDCADATNIVHDTTVWNYFWGIKQAADINPQCDPNFNYLNRVTVKTNFGHILIGPVKNKPLDLPDGSLLSVPAPKALPGRRTWR